MCAFIVRRDRPLASVGEAAETRRKWPKKRSLHVINEHFEVISNAVLATQPASLRSVKQPGLLGGSIRHRPPDR